MTSRAPVFIAAACLSIALASCGSGSAEFSGNGASPNQEAVAWGRALNNVDAAKSRAAELVDAAAAAAAPTATAISTARNALDKYVEAAESAVAAAESLQRAGGSDQRAAARSALSAAQSFQAENQQRLNNLQALPGENAQSEENPVSRFGRRWEDFRARTRTHLERGYTFRRDRGSSTGIVFVPACSESGGTCYIGGFHQNANQYLTPAFFSVTGTTTPITDVPINGVEAFFDGDEDNEDRDGSISIHNWDSLALGQYSAAMVSVGRDFIGSTLDRVIHYGVALGERHSGRPAGTSGSATWRGQMVGAAMDNGGLLAGESALTYSFSDNTVDVRISNIRAIGDVAPYAGSRSFTWNGLIVNSDGSFYIPGYNNDRSEVALSNALHSTLGYIDGDFYGPNAEESAGIFTRGNVNGAWVARRSGSGSTQTIINEDAEPGDAPEPGDSTRPGEGTQSEDTAEPDESSGSSQNIRTLVRSRLNGLRARTLTHLERGHTFRYSGGSTSIVDGYRCSESDGTCISDGLSFRAAGTLNRAFFHATDETSSFAAPINGVETYSDKQSLELGLPGSGYVTQAWYLLALGQYSVAKLANSRVLIGASLDIMSHYGTALGERHSGRPAGTSGSATWRGRMVGLAMDNGSLLAGESALTYSFSTNTVDVRISNIRAIGDVAPYAGSTSFTWSGLSVNSDGSFYISGYNNDRSGVTLGSALHSTQGYIDGDFYGPNAEESAGIFTRGNVNGAWVAKK